MAILAQRFHELGDESSAHDMLRRLQERALKNADELLWLADLHRRMGDDAAADAIELELLRSRRLHVERIPEAITRLKASLGAQEAFREAEGAAAYTLHPDLLVLLCELSEETSQPERLAHWMEIQGRATEVLEKFKQDKKASVRK
jgi:hypothetical protein